MKQSPKNPKCTNISNLSPLAQVKKEIVLVLVNNIYKVCFLVKKKNISALNINFMDNNHIKLLVIRMLKDDTFHKVKEDFSSLWEFVNKNHAKGFFQRISDDVYRRIYRDLIALA